MGRADIGVTGLRLGGGFMVVACDIRDPSNEHIYNEGYNQASNYIIDNKTTISINSTLKLKFQEFALKGKRWRGIIFSSCLISLSVMNFHLRLRIRSQLINIYFVEKRETRKSFTNSGRRHVLQVVLAPEVAVTGT